MVYKSEHKYALIAPLKARRVAKVLSGKSYNLVVSYLKNLPHKSAKLILKVAQSATANALSKDKQLDETQLIVKSIIINEGPRMKRIWPRARGRADILHKRMCHIAVEVSVNKKESK